MGKIDLKNYDREKIVQYLKKDKLKKEHTLLLVAWSIGNLLVASFFVYKEQIWLFGILSGFIVIGVLVYLFLKKAANTKRNLCYFQGIFSITTAISCGMLSYILLREVLRNIIIRFVLIVIFITILVGVDTFFSCKKQLETARGGFDVGIWQAILPGLAVSFVLWLRVTEFHVNPYLFFGLLLALVTVVCAMNISYFVKAYCYHLLEEDEKKSIIPEDAIILVESTGCHFCEQARAWLKEHDITYVSRNITEEKVRVPEIRNWHEKSNLSISQFLNVHSIPYKSMRLKDRLPEMADEEVYWAMAKNELLMKKPLLVSKDFVLVGFKDYEWKEKLIKK